MQREALPEIEDDNPETSLEKKDVECCNDQEVFPNQSTAFTVNLCHDLPE